MTKWQYASVTHRVFAYRTGWRGAWDAIKAALRGDDRVQLPLDLTFGIYHKGDCELLVCGASVEISEPKALEDA